MKVNTKELKELVNKASVCSVKNKLLPLTSLMEIQLANGELKLTTTDGSTYLFVKKAGVEGEDFKVVVETELFSKLVKKITSEFIEIGLTEKYLKLSGNGDYKIELLFDNGGEINYPNPLTTVELVDPVTVKVVELQNIYDVLKSSRALTTEVLPLTGYSFGSRAVTTDGYVMSAVDSDVFKRSCLLSDTALNLGCRAPEEDMKAYFTDNAIVLETPTYVVYSELMDASGYPTERTIDSLLGAQEDYKCEIAKTALLGALDRLELFVSPNSRAIEMAFNKDYLELTTEQVSAGSEQLSYRDNTGVKAMSLKVNIDYLEIQLKAMPDDSVTIEYGAKNMIKLVAGNVTKVVALLAS